MTPIQSTPAPATLAIFDPAFVKQKQLEDQLSKTQEENLALEKQNLQLRKRDIEFQGQILIEHGKIADLREQLFTAQDRSKHLERNAEHQELELSRFKATVSDGLKESSNRRRQTDDKFASDLNKFTSDLTAALALRRESLQNCDHMVFTAMSLLQKGKLGSDDGVPTPAESPQGMPQRRTSIFGGESSFGGNHSDYSASDGTRVPAANVIEKDQATGATASPRAPDTASKKRSLVVEPSGEAVPRGRGRAKKAKTTDQKSPHSEEEGSSRTYPAISFVAYQNALEQNGPKNPPIPDESSCERLKVVVGANGMPRKGFVGKNDASLQESSGTGGKKAKD